jgi:hypothetical protein
MAQNCLCPSVPCLHALSANLIPWKGNLHNTSNRYTCTFNVVLFNYSFIKKVKYVLKTDRLVCITNFTN